MAESAVRLPAMPYVGLVPHGEADAPFFFGRESERQIVTGNLRSARLTIVLGPSGVGKTSLLEAGVVHHLRSQVLAATETSSERPLFAICSFRAWRDEPLPALLEAIRFAAVEALGGEELPAPSRLDSAVEVLWSWTERVRTLLVVLDQFEDYFLYHADDTAEGTFAVEFPRIVNEPNLRVNCLLSIREDAWAKLDRFEGRIPNLFDNYVRIEHLDREGAYDAIVRPVDQWNRLLPDGEEPYAVEDQLAAAVIDATGIGRLVFDAGDGAGTRGEAAIETPFLQLVMERIWRETVATGARVLTLARLEALGGAERVVRTHLVEALDALSPPEQAVAAEIFRYLVSPSRTKIAYSASDLAEYTALPEPEILPVLDKLSRGRIVRPVSGADVERFELFHDVLAEPILEWRREHARLGLGAEQRRRVRRRLALLLALMVCVIAALTALLAAALVQRDDARRTTRLAISDALASASSAQLPKHVGAALLLAYEALRASPTVTAKSSMTAALEHTPRAGRATILQGDAGPVSGIAFNAKGTVLAAAGAAGAVQVWDVDARRRVGPRIGLRTGAVSSVAFSRDGRVLAAAGDDGAIRVWDLSTRKLRDVLHNHCADAVALSPDARRLAAVCNDGTLRLWDVSDGELLAGPLRGHAGPSSSVAVGPDGHTLALASGPTILLWNLNSREVLGPPLRGHRSRVASIAFSPDGRALASGGLDGTIRLWDVSTHETLGEPVRLDAGRVSSVAFSPDGQTLAAGSTDGAVRLWRGLLWSSLADLRTRVCGLVHRNLTRAEWMHYAPYVRYHASCTS